MMFPPFRGLAAPSVFHMPSRNHLWWNRSALHNTEMICLPIMQIRRFNSTIWLPGSGVKYDIQPMETIYQEHNHRLTQWNNTLLNPPLLESYAHAIASKGSPLPNCFGFIDGTVSPTFPREQNQRIAYNGHKRVHGLKYSLLSYLMVW